MSYETKNNTATLFKNDRRESATHPHAKGKALIGGVWYWVSAWTKEPRQGGDKFQSLSFQEMSEEHVAKYAGGGGNRDGMDQRPEVNRRTAPPARRDPRAEQRQRAASSAPSPIDEDPQFGLDDVPFVWSGRNTLPL